MSKIGRLIRRSYISVLVEEDRELKIILSGFTNPIMFHIIVETPYSEQEEVLFVDIQEAARIIGCSERVLRGAFGFK